VARWVNALARRATRIRSWFFRAGVWGTAAAAAIYGAIALADSNDVPSPGFFDQFAGLQNLLGLIVLLVGPFTALYLHREIQRVEHRRQVIETCHVLLLLVTLRSKLPLESLSAYVWRPSGWPGRRRLSPVAKARVQARKSSGIVWTYGKGVIGRCWASNQDEFGDLSELQRAAYAGPSAFEPIREKYGMTYEEARKTNRYASVIASPLRNDDGDFIGCVALDCSMGDSFSILRAALDGDEVQPTIATIERLVRLI
jgi:hypothetical protein